MTLRRTGPEVATWILLLACQGSAFDCLSSLPQRQSLANAFLVFQGKAVDIRAVVNGQVDLVTFDVQKTWKGPASRSINVVAFRYHAMGDGYTFRLGTDYIVYATKELNKGWVELERVAGNTKVYGLPNCLPRVRTDLTGEMKLLGGHWRKPDDGPQPFPTEPPREK